MFKRLALFILILLSLSGQIWAEPGPGPGAPIGGISNTFTGSFFDFNSSVRLRNHLGPELVTNGTFTGAATGWTLGTGWAYSANTVVKNADGTGTLSPTTALTITANSIYRVAYAISSMNVSSVTASIGGVTLPVQSDDDSAAVFYVTASSTANLVFTPTNTSRFTIDNVSVKKVGTAGTDTVVLFEDDRDSVAGGGSLFSLGESGGHSIRIGNTGIGLGDSAQVNHQNAGTANYEYGVLGKINSGAGGLNISGYTDADGTALALNCLVGSEDPTDTTPSCKIVASKKSGSSSQALGASETVLQILNNTTELFTQVGDGSYRQPASTYHNFGATIGASGYGIYDDGGTIKFKNSSGAWAKLYDLAQVTPPGAPTVAVNVAAGNLNSTYVYRVTYVTATGETEAGTVSSSVAPANEKVDLSAIPVSADPRVTARKIYRSRAGEIAGDIQARIMQLVTTINDNVTTTYTDNTADGALGVYLATVNTTGHLVYVNTERSGFIDTLSTAWGYQALQVNTGLENTGIGLYALKANTYGFMNTATGAYALQANTVGYFNSAYGQDSLRSNISGYYNSAYGVASLRDNETGFQNTAVGRNSLNNNISASYNSCVGMNCMYTNTVGHSNSALGEEALYSNDSGDESVAVGKQAAYSNVTGNNIIAIGKAALYSATVGNNVAIGRNSQYSTSTGQYNVSVGNDSLYSNTLGYDNMALGSDVLYDNTEGYYLVGIGTESLHENITGYANTGVGRKSLYSNTTGHDLVGIGVNAGRYITGGVNPNQTSTTSVYIGNETRASANGNDNEIVIGDSTTGLGTNTSIIGNTSTLKHVRYGKFVLNDTSSPNNALGLTINQLTNDDEILSLKSSDVGHSFTTDTEADTFLYAKKLSATLGGAGIWGLSDGDATGLQLTGAIGIADPTNTIPAVVINGVKLSGTTYGAVGNDEIVAQVTNNGTALTTWLGNGNVGIGTTTFGTSLVGGLAMGVGTAPTGTITGAQLVPVNENGANTASFHMMNQLGQYGAVAFKAPLVNLLSNSGFGVWSNGTLENVGSQLVASWANVDYDTFTSTDADITSAIYTTAGTQDASSAAITLVSGKLYKIVVTLTLNSGQAPTLAMTNLGHTSAAISAGANTFVREATDTTTTLTVSNTAAANWSATFTLYEVTPGCVAVDALGPDGWQKYPAASVVLYREHNGTNTKDGSFYSLKIVPSAINSEIFLLITNEPKYLRNFYGRKISFGAWVKTSTASHAKLRIIASDIAVANSSTHTGGGDWEWLEITTTLATSLTDFFPEIFLALDSGIVYISQPMLIFGPSIGAGNYVPSPNETIYTEKVIALTDYTATTSAADATINLETQSSGMIPKGVKAVLVKAYAKDSAAGDGVGFDVQSASGVEDGLSIDTQVNNVRVQGQGWVKANSDGDIVLDHRGSGASALTLDIKVIAVQP